MRNTPHRSVKVDDLSTTAIQRKLTTRIFGRPTYYYPQVDSTNTALKILAGEGAPEGALAIANEQTAGRGRFKRRWRAPAGSSLLTSLLFRPAFLPPARAQTLMMLCSLAAVDAIEMEAGITTEIKWPNDLVYGGRKLAGLLSEMSFDGATLEWVVVGMGMNVNLDFSAFKKPDPDSGLPLARTASSLQMIVKRPVSRLSLLQAYLEAVERRYNALQAGQSPHPEWRAKLTTLGQKITVSGAGSMLRGLAEDVDEDGALLLRLADRQLERILAGDVSVVKGK